MQRAALWIITVFTLSIAVSGQVRAERVVSLNGAGASFPFPLYTKWISEYHRSHPDIQINYQSIGSGAGIRQISERTLDFGASDAPMANEQLAKARGKLIHLPMTLGAVAVIYNLEGAPSGLKLTAEVIAGIFLGEIQHWNNQKIVSQNPGMALPATTISVVHRSDGSGTTAVFTDYLSKVSETWKNKVGTGTSVNWPLGLGGKGNEGVSGVVKITPGAIGYVELAYAKQGKLPFAAIQNRAGQSVSPSIEGITAAAGDFTSTIPDDFRVSIVDAPGANSYPISSFTYILVYEDTADVVKGTSLAQFLRWAIHEGQALGPALDYAPLPAALVTRISAKLNSLRCGDQTCLPVTQ